MTIALIDNYDSFTYNLYHLLRELGAETTVVRNDRFPLPFLETFDRLVLSPGPGIPSEAGLLPDVIRHYATRKPILGICLGHQALAEAYGARLTNLEEVVHGVATPCHVVAPDPLYEGLPETFDVGRYHSWVVDSATLPPCLEATALSPDGLIMSLRHRTLPLTGIQYHPESVLTPLGRHIIGNWLTQPLP